jgi:hypothetical protein
MGHCTSICSTPFLKSTGSGSNSYKSLSALIEKFGFQFLLNFGAPIRPGFQINIEDLVNVIHYAL